ncbi:dephospho-CoA kinase [Oceaniferula spumae]|uniref:Dephospho-CoA kinase n=1 Tax=Oceaniferula spumae TaxID=2979115 RepID=A0AAT9FJ14_9BACT
MNNDLQIIGLTGGIATGKSTCARTLQELLPETVLFDADASVRSLYENNAVLDEIGSYFGSGALLPGGGVDKAFLRERAFSNPEDKEFLEQVFHPRVREECLALLLQTSRKGVSRLFVADVPLLFENGFDFGQSANLLVATSRKTQVDRLIERNKWDDGTVQAVLSSQMPIEAKHGLADVVIWNEGPVDILRSQCRRFIQSRNISI